MRMFMCEFACMRVFVCVYVRMRVFTRVCLGVLADVMHA